MLVGLLSRWSCALLALAVLPGSAAAGRGKEKLVPANFSAKQDALGFSWDVNSYGMINDGTSDCFDGGLALNVGGSRFNASQRMMSSDGREYVLLGTVSGAKVTRRILIDRARGAARYIEVFENPGKTALQLTAVVQSTLGGNCQHAITSAGVRFSGGYALGKKELGILTVGQGSRPCVMFLVTGRRNKEKPRVTNQNNRTFQFTYSLKVKPQGRASLVHLVAQRRGVSATNVADLFKAFYRNRLIKPEIPPHLRRTVVNFRAVPGADAGDEIAPLLGPVLELAENFGVERGKADVLVVDEESHLSGTARSGPLKLATRHGGTEVPFSEVALLAGAAGVGRPVRVYLRNGECLTGDVDAGEMGIGTESGMEIELAPERINMLFTRADGSDGKPSPGAAAMLETHFGERLALARGRQPDLRAQTPWGPLCLTLDEIERLYRLREPQPICRLVLRDGSRLPVILDGEMLAFETLRFGTVRLAPHAVSALLRVKAKRPRAETPAPRESPEGPPEAPEWPTDVRRLLEKKVSFLFVDTPISEAVAFLGTLTKLNMILDPRATEGNETPINLKGKNEELGVAFDKIVKQANLGWCWKDGAIFITTRTEMPARDQTSPAKPWPPKVASALERKVSFEFVDTPLREAVAFLRTLSKLDIVLDAKGSASVPITLKVTKMKLAFAFRWILRLAEMDFIVKDGQILLTRPEGAPADDDGELSSPHFLLAGESLLVGVIDLPELRVVTSTGVTALDPREISVMERRDEEETAFSFEPKSGGTLIGRLEEHVLPIRRGERVLRVPVEHVLSFRAKPEAGEEGTSP